MYVYIYTYVYIYIYMYMYMYMHAWPHMAALDHAQVLEMFSLFAFSRLVNLNVRVNMLFFS